MTSLARGTETRKNEAKKHSLHGVNEHFEPNFDTASADSEQSEASSAVIFHQPLAAGVNIPKYYALATSNVA
ncbi:MAG: hypothetical protein KQH63_16175 [Desulfobulbaceae bacterium]|nr:hypothetical protein [Desulfobulbaceae bacterium]